MNIQEKIEWLENELKELKEEVTEKQEKKGNTWKPKEGEDFWYIDEDGEVYGDYVSAHHEGKYRIGNIFKTEEDAQFMVERLKVIQELKPFARPFKSKEKNWVITFDYLIDRVHIVFNTHILDDTLYFESEETAKQAIESIGEDRIKKYYLQIAEGK